MLSVGTSCALTLPQFSKNSRVNIGSAAPEKNPTIDTIFMVIDYVCGIWFTFELLMRITFCPRRRIFIRQVTNWIDILSVIPFYLRLIDPDGGPLADALLMIRLLRLFRFFRLLYGLQIILHTLKASSYELGLLLLILLIPVVLFSSIIYYTERTFDGDGTKFGSIPESFWWSLITMTTVGYGDIVPKTWIGKIIGGACAICGLLVVALPISIIGSNFNLYYAHAQARLKLPKKRNRVLLSSITSDFSSGRASSGPRRRGLRMRSHVALETGDDENIMPGMSNGRSYRLNSFPRQNSYEVKSRTGSLPTSNGQTSDPKTSPTSSWSNRERKYSRNERILPKLGDLPEKDESGENENVEEDQGSDFKPDLGLKKNSRNSLNVPGVTHGTQADRLPLWIAESSKTPRVRSFSVPSNTHRTISGPPPRKTQSQGSDICKRCSLPKDESSNSSSGEVCCCSEKRGVSLHGSNTSTYTIFIPGTDEGVQVSMESIPSWSRQFSCNGTSQSPVQLDVVPCFDRPLPDEDSETENQGEQDEQETLVSELASEDNNSRREINEKTKGSTKGIPLLYMPKGKAQDKISDKKTPI